MLQAMGVRVQRGQGEASVWPVERLEPLSIDVPGDLSSAAPFIVAAALLPESRLRIHGVNVNPTRIGLLDVLERMGARISLFNRRQASGEPVADLEIEHAELVGPRSTRARCRCSSTSCRSSACSPLWRAARASSAGRRAAVKETDRIETTTTLLRKIGAHVRSTRDGFRIRGVPARPRGGVVDAAGDHRIAMLGAVAGLVSRDGVRIEGAEAVSISFPGFFDLLARVAQR